MGEEGAGGAHPRGERRGVGGGGRLRRRVGGLEAAAGGIAGLLLRGVGLRAWAMLIVPPLVGWVVGGWSWLNLLLLPAWLNGYLTYWAWSQWLRTRSPRKRALLIPPMVVYTGLTAGLGLLTILLAPYLLQPSLIHI